MELQSYTLDALESHLLQCYTEPGSNLSVSPLRLSSYLANPRAQKNDVVLFEMRIGRELVGYRTLLPDLFFDPDGTPHRFAWLSGNWVRPDMRRKGISSLLLNAAEAAWDEKLIYTNYAPASKALYDHTGSFRIVAQRNGQRFYLRSNTEELLGNRLGARRLLRSGDQLLNRIRNGKLERYQFPTQEHYNIEEVHEFDPDLEDMIHHHQKQSLFRREADVFNWVLNHPWITDRDVAPLKYHFSYRSKKFKNLLFKYKQPETENVGMLWLIIHNNTLSAPYLFSENDSTYSAMAETIAKTMIQSRSTHATFRHPKLINELASFPKLFLHVRKMPQLIFAHKSVADLIPEQLSIQDGDGDVVFTG